MNKRIKQYLDDIFSPYKNSNSIQELKEELLNNMQEKYKDLIKDGLDDEAAYQKVISDLGDISEIIKNISDKSQELHQRVSWDRSEYDKNFEVSPGGFLHLDSDIGSVEIKGADTNKVDIKVYYDDRDFSVNFEKQGNDIYIRGRHRGGRWMWLFWFSFLFFNWRRIRFVITVPRVYNLDIKTAGGMISVINVEGQVFTTTSGGKLDIYEVKGPVTGKTSGGSIHIQKCAGRIDMKTSGGTIHIGDTEGDVNAHTSGGSITMGRINGNVLTGTSGGSINLHEISGSVDAHTSGGGINAMLTKQPNSGCRMTTSGGGINVTLIHDIAIDLDAKTSGGHVHSEFPVAANMHGSSMRSVLMGKINGGGPMMILRTSGGGIHIRKI